MSEDICPVCGEEFFERSEHTLSWDQLDSFGSNCLWGECVRITRKADDGLPWYAETFEHDTEQTFRMGP
jgi:hypothetical protein